MRVNDLTGQIFGKLKVLERAGSKHGGRAAWKCICECGTECIKIGRDMQVGHTKSCGCLLVEFNHKTHYKHGMWGKRLGVIYHNMKSRCYNPNDTGYANYGGRGIEMCKDWKDNPASFAEWASMSGYTDSLSIDRIDYNGNYTPENCRWVSNKTQQNNKRNNTYITFRGETKTMSEWATYFGIPYKLLKSRNQRGYTAEEMLTLKPREKRNKIKIA